MIRNQGTRCRRAALVAYDVCRRALAPSDPARWAAMRPVHDAWVQMSAAARAAGVPVIYTTPVSRSDGADVVMLLTDLSAETGVPPLTNAVEGTAEAGFPDDIAPRPEDYVFLKRRPSAFYGAGVAELLHMLRRDTIIIGGGATNLGVHTTSPTCYRVTRDGPNEGTWEEVMRFGFFDQLPCAPGYSEPQ